MLYKLQLCHQNPPGSFRGREHPQRGVQVDGAVHCWRDHLRPGDLPQFPQDRGEYPSLFAPTAALYVCNNNSEHTIAMFINLCLLGEAVCGRGAEDVEQHRANHHLSQQGCGPVEKIGKAEKGV